MEHRALSWLKREYRHDVFRLITTSGVNPRVFFFRKDAELKSEQESESEQDEDSVSSANLVSLVNDLLKIDFESFFLKWPSSIGHFGINIQFLGSHGST